MNPQTPKLELVAYRSEKGLYYANTKWNYRKERESIYSVDTVNGKPLTKSEHRNDWYFLEGEDTITSIKKHVHGGYGAASWVLRDDSTFIDGVIPRVVTPEDGKYFQENGNYPRQVQFFKSDGKTVHPTQKPVALMEYLIKTYTNEGETVLDFTMGSGTTGVACSNLNRKFIGIEMDDNYFEIAKSRILSNTP